MQKAAIIILISVVLICLGKVSFAQRKEKEKESKDPGKITWMSFEEAYQKNKKKPKKVFIDVYTDWCGWCKKMDAETFTDPAVVKYMTQHFYCVKLNAERKDTVVIDNVTFINPNPDSHRSTHQLANELLRGNMSYPSYVFLNEKSQWLTVVQGYQSVKDFIPILHYFGEDAYIKTPWEEYKSKYLDDNTK
ncbi:MAG: thioredoxin family protein [Bacteroidota bacterium]|nr:thioredoxin family protein [Bacteroidota bacterium]